MTFILAPLRAKDPRFTSYIWAQNHSRFWVRLIVHGPKAVAFLGLLVAAAARLYIVVESFISLRSVLLGIYAMPDWTMYFPHF